MDGLFGSVQRFFDGLEVYEDKAHGRMCRMFLKQASAAFLRDGNKETAFMVYRAFFDSYRIELEGQKDAFIDLLDMLRQYEENAAVLIDKQRDHYVHSVNVFLLGLAIYADNAAYRSAADTLGGQGGYAGCHATACEEFFFRWGLAALFHDVGYPVEIVGRQINRFCDFAADADGANGHVGVQLRFQNFGELNSIAEIRPKREFARYFLEKYPDSVYVDPQKPIDLLAHRLHDALGVELKAVKRALDAFPDVMAQNGFIDHGFYSALIVLKWYGCLIQRAGYEPARFYEPVLDSASAILLHNCYRNMMQKKPFSLGALEAKTHPIAFLLILCDELQEWNRTAYGIRDRRRTLAAEARVDLSGEGLRMVYISRGAPLDRGFAHDKKKLLGGLLALDEAFSAFSVATRVRDEGALPAAAQPAGKARPNLVDMEKLARAIHEDYNQKQLSRCPEKPLAYPSFEALPEALQYSNLRQAMDIPNRLFEMGFEMRKEDSAGERIETIPAAYVEALARREHEAWMQERTENGWTYGAQRDAEKKTSPYLLPYAKLPEPIKQLDRDPIENIPRLLGLVGMAVYRL